MLGVAVRANEVTVRVMPREADESKLIAGGRVGVAGRAFRGVDVFVVHVTGLAVGLKCVMYRQQGPRHGGRCGMC